jgi:hypothetical protein
MASEVVLDIDVKSQRAEAGLKRLKTSLLQTKEAFSNVLSEVENYNEELSEIEARVSDNVDTLKKLRDAVERAIDAGDIDTAAKLSSEYIRLFKATETLNKKQKETGAVVKETTANVSELSESLKEAGDSFGNTGKEVNKFFRGLKGGEIADVLEGLGKLPSALGKVGENVGILRGIFVGAFAAIALVTESLFGVFEKFTGFITDVFNGIKSFVSGAGFSAGFQIRKLEKEIEQLNQKRQGLQSLISTIAEFNRQFITSNKSYQEQVDALERVAKLKRAENQLAINVEADNLKLIQQKLDIETDATKIKELQTQLDVQQNKLKEAQLRMSIDDQQIQKEIREIGDKRLDTERDLALAFNEQLRIKKEFYVNNSNALAKELELTKELFAIERQAVAIEIDRVRKDNRLNQQEITAKIAELQNKILELRLKEVQAINEIKKRVNELLDLETTRAGSNLRYFLEFNNFVELNEKLSTLEEIRLIRSAEIERTAKQQLDAFNLIQETLKKTGIDYKNINLSSAEELQRLKDRLVTLNASNEIIKEFDNLIIKATETQREFNELTLQAKLNEIERLATLREISSEINKVAEETRRIEQDSQFDTAEAIRNRIIKDTEFRISEFRRLGLNQIKIEGQGIRETKELQLKLNDELQRDAIARVIETNKRKIEEIKLNNEELIALDIELQRKLEANRAAGNEQDVELIAAELEKNAKLREKNAAQITAIVADTEQKTIQIVKSGEEKKTQIEINAFEARKKRVLEILSFISQAEQTAFSVINSFSERRINELDRQIERQRELTQTIVSSLETQTGAYANFSQAQLQIEQQRLRELDRLRQEEIGRQRIASKIQIALQTGIALARLFAETPKADFGIGTFIAAGLLVANLFAQIVAAQNQAASVIAERGGKIGETLQPVTSKKLVGRSHKQGGIHLEAEGGEWIFDKETSAKYDSLFRDIYFGKVNPELFKKTNEPLVRTMLLLNSDELKRIRLATEEQVSLLKKQTPNKKLMRPLKVI